MGIINFTNQKKDTMAEIDADVKAQIEQIATAAYGNWKANATEEQKAAGLEMVAKMGSDEEFKNGKMAEMAAKFGECDANGDGLLQRDEYINWVGVMNGIAKAEGHWVDENPETHSGYYAGANMVTPGVDGVSMQDCFVVMGIAMAKNMELKAADGL